MGRKNCMYFRNVILGENEFFVDFIIKFVRIFGKGCGYGFGVGGV